MLYGIIAASKVAPPAPPLQASAFFSGSGSLSPTISLIENARAILGGSGALSADGILINPLQQASASFAGSGTFSINGELANPIIQASASFTGAGTLSVNATTPGPATIFGANLMAWYSADAGAYSDAGSTLATDGQSVQQWNDQSGNNAHLTQATSGQRPVFNSSGLNSLPSLTFNSANAKEMTTGTSSVALGVDTFAVFAVCTMSSGTNEYGRLVAFKATGDSYDYASITSAIPIQRASTANMIDSARNYNNYATSTSVSLDTPMRAGSIFDGTYTTIYINNSAGTQIGSTGTFGATGQLKVGGGIGIGGYSWTGEVSEIVAIKSNPTSDQRTALDNYFKAKWGFS